MGLDWIPGLSQVKSTVQLLSGDVKGAAKTQSNFLHSCPGVAQVTSVAHLATGNTDRFVEINRNPIRTVSNVADGIPVVGHVKAVVHELTGDSAAAEKSLLAANRTTCVAGGGVAGFFVAGPVGAVAGGVYAGVAHDCAHSVITKKDQGFCKKVDDAVKNPNFETITDAALVPIGDGLTGYAAGQIIAPALAGGSAAASTGTASASTTIAPKTVPTWNPSAGGGSVFSSKTLLSQVPKETVYQAAVIGTTAALYVLDKSTMRPPQLEKKPRPAPSPTQTYTPTETVTAPSLDNTDLPTYQSSKIIENEDATQLEKSLEELLQWKDQVEIFQEKVVLTYGIRLDQELCKPALEFLQKCRKALKKKKKEGTLGTCVTLVALVEASMENDDEDEDDEDNGVIKNRKLRCIQWNMCGFVAQTLLLKQKSVGGWLAHLNNLSGRCNKESLGKSLQFLILLMEKRPHILMLNELKVRNEEIVRLLASCLGFGVEFSPSNTTGRAALRGTAIAYRQTQYLTFKDTANQQPILDNDFKPVLEVVKVNFDFHSKQMVYNSGMVENLKTYNLTFVGAYLHKCSYINFIRTCDAFEALEDGITIFAGDLNMEKTEWRGKWEQHGFVDMLEDGWKTNRQTSGTRVTETEIDYVMVKNGNEPHVTVEKPIEFIGASLHYPIYFEVHDRNPQQ